MKLSRPILLISTLSFLGAVAAAAGACSATVSLPGLPSGAAGVTAGFTYPVGISATSSCTPGDYYGPYEDSSGPCSGETYLLCDDSTSTYSQYDCTDPASSGWTLATGTSAEAGVGSEAGVGNETGTTEAGAGETGATEAGAGETGATEAGGGETGAAEAGGGEAGATEAGGGGTDSGGTADSASSG